MSLDYPNRAEWLAVRATPAKRSPRYAHVSVQVAMRRDKHGVMHPVRTPRGQGRTYRRPT